MKLEKKVIVAIRKAEDSIAPYIDTLSISLSYTEMYDKLCETEKNIPQWNKANPVVKIVECKIVCLEDID